MDKKTKGAWLIHHTNKLQQVVGPASFDNILVAGKSGVLLSAISASEQAALDNARVEALARASNINIPFELPRLLDLLHDKKLIAKGKAGIDVLGVTTSAVLSHSADIFNERSPTPSENATIEMAEMTSSAPIEKAELQGLVSDSFALKSSDAAELLDVSEQVGFLDAEQIDKDRKLFFNGNLFRRASAAKVKAVLDSVAAADRTKMSEVEGKLTKHACMSAEEVQKILGVELFKKLHSVGLYDVCVVSNASENVAYVTRPSAFAKYGNAMVEDALDFAKAFVSSLTYGMTRRNPSQGRITMIQALMRKLIRGHWVGPVTAIGEDYKVLELKRVVEVRPGAKYGHEMRLLKKEVGELALQAILSGDISEQSLPSFPGATVTSFTGPERNREIRRRKQNVESKKATRDILLTLRTGGTV